MLLCKQVVRCPSACRNKLVLDAAGNDGNAGGSGGGVAGGGGESGGGEGAEGSGGGGGGGGSGGASAEGTGKKTQLMNLLMQLRKVSLVRLCFISLAVSARSSVDEV